MNPACGKVLLRKTLVTPDSRREQTQAFVPIEKDGKLIK
jgi:hypothetical protein